MLANFVLLILNKTGLYNIKDQITYILFREEIIIIIITRPLIEYLHKKLMKNAVIFCSLREYSINF